ncbi:alanine racemase [Caulobacter sp. CCNWLY153]|uniref:alanine racemase n=1 Tax=unclassified Caulobacter TaxID=2648921 RepID=UPI002FF29B33
MTDARLTLDLDALAANYATLKATAGDSELAPAVKADGYGLGAGLVARRLWDEGARGFYVARLSEGVALRKALGEREARIHVLDGATPGSGPTLVQAGLIPVLNSLPQVEAWNSQAGRGVLEAAIHVDTGMNRLGLRHEEAAVLTASMDRLKHLNVSLVVSHLACAGEPEHPLNTRQLTRFRDASALFPNARKSLANSAGVFLGGDYHFDQCRPGIALYGGGPRDVTDTRLKAVATLEAPILQVRVVPRGESIGYGAAFTASETTRVAVLACGYADGVLRGSSPAGHVWFDGARRRLLGRVSMDLIAIDVTDCDAARPGALVELIGPNLPVDEAAAAAGTTAYELLVRLAGRARRVVLGEA